jgi:hypothetical protein
MLWLAYWKWRNSFHAEVPQPDWFKHYLIRFDTVEIIRSCCGLSRQLANAYLGKRAKLIIGIFFEVGVDQRASDNPAFLVVVDPDGLGRNSGCNCERLWSRSMRGVAYFFHTGGQITRG